jgi:hypothetical protein
MRGAKIYLYYAKFPNTYLSNLAMHGAKYSQMFPSPEHKVKLYRSEGYNMEVAGGQAQLFRDMASLLWYLADGKDYVGNTFS